MTVSILTSLQKLEKRGFTLRPAEGIVEHTMDAITDSDLVTKTFFRTELALFEAKFETKFEAQIERKIADLKIELKTDTAQLELKLTSKMESLETKLIGRIADMKIDVIK